MCRILLPLRRMKALAIRLFQSMRADSRPLWLRIVQLLISICVLGFVYVRLSQEDWQSWQTHLPQSGSALAFIAFCLCLAPLNLGLETRKWQLLIQPYYPQIGFRQLFKAVLAGMASGIFTPNRIGEYAGRIMSLPKGFRLEAGTHTLVNRLLQMYATVLFGSLSWWGLWWNETDRLREIFPFSVVLVDGISIFLGLVCGLCLLVLWRPQASLLLLRVDRLPWRFAQRVAEALLAIDAPALRRAQLLAILRYTVFSGQYLLLLFAFGYEGNISLILGLIALCFLIKSLLPSIALTELGVRESVALWLMGAFGIGAFNIVSSTFLLYVCNLMLPSLLGLFYIYRIRA
ncbi:MAG: lysylphosphatidylglycerol synthase domain-containing protein [Bacteroidota bacterium]